MPARDSYPDRWRPDAPRTAREPLPPVRAEPAYRRLLGNEAWRRLHPAIRRRFAVRPASAPIRFRGVMTRVDCSAMGWLFSQACRLLGRALTTRRGTDVPVDIRLSWDPILRGVTWRRRYRFDDGPPMTVLSTKVGDVHELVERVGRRFSMTMVLEERGGDLAFVSTGYWLHIGRHRVRVPGWLTPGVTTVTHEHVRPERFRFTLIVIHPFLGTTFRQEGMFRDVSEKLRPASERVAVVRLQSERDADGPVHQQVDRPDDQERD